MVMFWGIFESVFLEKCIVWVGQVFWRFIFGYVKKPMLFISFYQGLSPSRGGFLSNHAVVVVWWLVGMANNIHPGKCTAGTQKRRWMVQMISLFNWVMFRFQPLIFQGVSTIHINCCRIEVTMKLIITSKSILSSFRMMILMVCPVCLHLGITLMINL